MSVNRVPGHYGVERGHPAPPSQCIPTGGTIVDDPTSIGRPTFCPDGGPPVLANEDGDHNNDDNDDDNDCRNCCVGDDHDNDADTTLSAPEKRQREQETGSQLPSR